MSKTPLRLALIIGAAALIVGCGALRRAQDDAPLPMDITRGVSILPDHLSYHQTFHYKAKEQSFQVPAGVTRITIDAVGARGGGDTDYDGRDLQALGGRVWAIIPVTPGETLAVFVGGPGSQPAGGFNGGGHGGGVVSCCRGYGGGGASDV